MKTTKMIVENFFEAMYAQNGWKELITDEITFSGPAMPLIKGKLAYIEATKMFLAKQQQSKIRSMIVEGDRACVMTNYKMGHPDAAILDLDACEIVQVKDGKIESLEIYLDSQKFANFMAKMKQ